MNIKEMIIGLKSHYIGIVHDKYKYSYSYVNTITGEVRTIRSDSKGVIKLLYKQLDGDYRRYKETLFERGNLIICALHSEKCIFYKHLGGGR